MKHTFILFPLLCLLLAAASATAHAQAADTGTQQAANAEKLACFTGDYVGNMLIGSDFTQEQVRVTLSANGDVTLHKVKFAKLMPFKVTAVIPQLPITAGTDKAGREVLSVSCDSVIPRVGKTEFPSRMARQVSGTSDGKTMSFSALFGGKPLTFTGSKID